MERISVTIPKDVLNALENIMKEKGIRKRSNAITKAVELFIEENKMLSRKEEECVGTISYIFEHKRELLDKLLDLQHTYSNEIISTLHVHLDIERCFETLVVKGKIEKIRELINELMNMKLKNIGYKIV
ncbi:MAG: nickel-responsive transcriptional regulator NikR [Nitrososphaeria archaeon]|nr:nickel-responsive transcriptional regulator NikR [Nitrososphaeria archaeon]